MGGKAQPLVPVTWEGMCYSDEGQQGLVPGAAAAEQAEGWFISQLLVHGVKYTSDVKKVCYFQRIIMDIPLQVKLCKTTEFVSAIRRRLDRAPGRRVS